MRQVEIVPMQEPGSWREVKTSGCAGAVGQIRRADSFAGSQLKPNYRKKIADCRNVDFAVDSDCLVNVVTWAWKIKGDLLT